MPLMGEFGTRLYDFTSKIRTIVVRIGGVETVEFETSTIKDKDLARIFFFLSSSPFFPLSKDRTRCPLLPSSIYSDASWKEIQRQRTTLTKEIFILGGENRDIANNGITRAAFRVLKCVAINRSKSKRGMLLTARPSSFSIQFVPL